LYLKARASKRLNVAGIIPVLYKTFCRKDEVMGEWRRLHNEELNDFYWGMEEIA